MGIVKDILEFLRQFWPFQIVYSYQMGIRFWCGKDTKLVGPGVYMFIPFFSHVETVNVKPDIISLNTQTLTTKDGVSVLVSGNIAYEIFDARKSFVAVQTLVNNLADECRTQMAGGIREYEFAALLAEQGDLEATIMDNINEAAAEWGVLVTRVGLADFVKTKSLSLAKL